LINNEKESKPKKNKSFQFQRNRSQTTKQKGKKEEVPRGIFTNHYLGRLSPTNQKGTTCGTNQSE